MFWTSKKTDPMDAALELTRRHCVIVEEAIAALRDQNDATRQFYVAALNQQTKTAALALDEVIRAARQAVGAMCAAGTPDVRPYVAGTTLSEQQRFNAEPAVTYEPDDPGEPSMPDYDEHELLGGPPRGSTAPPEQPEQPAQPE